LTFRGDFALRTFSGQFHSVMLPLILNTVLGIVLRSPNTDDRFIQRITDKNWSEAIHHYPEFFVFLHLDHARGSDLAYLKYIHIVRKYQNIAQFFVMPAVLSEFVCRSRRIGGFPALLYIMGDNYTEKMLGSFSFDNLERFVQNHTKPRYTDLVITPTTTFADIVSLTKQDDYDEIPIVFILSTNETRFGRVSLQFARIVGLSNRCYRLTESYAARLFDARFPGVIVYLREDGTHHSYDGEPQLQLMIDWMSALRPPIVSRFRPQTIFSPNGQPHALVLRLVKRSDTVRIRDSLVEEARRFPLLNFSYADPSEHLKFLSDMGYSAIPPQICLAVNFSWISHVPCENPDEFISGRLIFSSTKVDREMYGYIAHVNEGALDDFLVQGPLFVIFYDHDSLQSMEKARFAQLAALRMARVGSRANWCIWDIHRERPSFEKDLDIMAPSIWWFRSSVLAEAEMYTGLADIPQMVHWAYQCARDFDIKKALDQPGTT
jgi:hypothetical protein